MPTPNIISRLGTVPKVKKTKPSQTPAQYAASILRLGPDYLWIMASFIQGDYNAFWASPIANAAALGTNFASVAAENTAWAAFINSRFAAAGVTGTIPARIAANGATEISAVAIPLATAPPAGWTCTFNEDGSGSVAQGT